MSAEVVLEGMMYVCMTAPNKHTSSLDGANVAVLEMRWVVLKKEKLKIYDKKRNMGRKKLLHVAINASLKGKGEIYVENAETKELYIAFPEKVCVFRFSQDDQYNKWANVWKTIFTPDSPTSPPLPPKTRPTTLPPQSANYPPSNPTNNPISPPNPRDKPLPSLPATTTSPRNTMSPSSTPSPPLTLSPEDSLLVGNPTLTASTNYHMQTDPSLPKVKQDPMLDLATTNDPELLKQEILQLRKKNAQLQTETETMRSILAMEKEFMRDKQAKLDSWEHFLRLVIFKAVCNQSKNEKLRLKINKILAKNLPTTKTIKISRMESTLVVLPTHFEQSPNFRLSQYEEETGVATFSYEWFPQNCTCTIQIDGYKYLGGAIPIGFKVSIDVLSELRIRGELLVCKGEGNQFLISLPRLPDLTFASPSKLKIGDIFDVSSFTLVQKAVEAAVFNALKKNLMQPKWKEVRF